MLPSGVKLRPTPRVNTPSLLHRRVRPDRYLRRLAPRWVSSIRTLRRYLRDSLSGLNSPVQVTPDACEHATLPSGPGGPGTRGALPQGALEVDPTPGPATSGLHQGGTRFLFTVGSGLIRRPAGAHTKSGRPKLPLVASSLSAYGQTTKGRGGHDGVGRGMTVWLRRLHVATLRLGVALRQYWKRVAVGAVCGWLVSTVLGAFVLVVLETRDVISTETSPLLGAALVWSGVGLGSLVAYASRPRT